MINIICLIKGHKQIPMLIEDDISIHAKGCKRCYCALGLPEAWKHTPAPPGTSNQEWNRYKEKHLAQVRKEIQSKIH